MFLLCSAFCFVWRFEYMVTLSGMAWPQYGSTRMLSPSQCSRAKQESLSYVLHLDWRGIFGLCGMARQIWLIVIIMLGQTSTGLPSRCPWTNLIVSIANIFIPFSIFSPSLPSCSCFAFSVCLLSNKNSALTTFFSPMVPGLLLLYPILGFLGNLIFAWYYWHGYLVGPHVPSTAHKLHVKLNHFSCNFTFISARSSHPSQSYLKFCSPFHIVISSNFSCQIPYCIHVLICLFNIRSVPAFAFSPHPLPR